MTRHEAVAAITLLIDAAKTHAENIDAGAPAGQVSVVSPIWRMIAGRARAALEMLAAEPQKLRGDLAKKVADLVEAQIVPDLNEALVGALKWRDAESLTTIATAVEGGAKPRMRGRESCLFLEVDDPSGRTHTVML